jgi:hypothetical protein
MKKKSIYFLFFALLFMISSYAQTEVDKTLTASTPLEKAVKDLADFLKPVPYGSTYFREPTLEFNTTLVLSTFNENWRIYLPNVQNILFFNPNTNNPRIKILSNKKRGPCVTINDRFTDTETWTGFNDNENASKFFVLLGNIVEAQHEAYFKNYKTEETYQKRLDFFKSKNIVDLIPKSSIIKLVGVSRADKLYKGLKKKIGDEFEVSPQLVLNDDLKTFSGGIFKGMNSYTVSNIEVEFISPPPGPNVEEIKKQQEEKQADSLFAAFNKEHFQTITAMSKKTFEANNQLLSKNGFSFIDESIVMAFTDLTNKKAYGQSYKLEQDKIYTFIVTGVGLNKVSVRYGGKTLNTPALGDDPYFASVTKSLTTGADGTSQYILTITAKPNFTQSLMIEVYGDFFQYAYIRRYKKK